MGTIARLGGEQREGLTFDRGASDRQKQICIFYNDDAQRRASSWIGS